MSRQSESALNAALIGKNHLQGVCNVCLFPVYVAQNVLESASVPYFSNPYCCISQAAQSPVWWWLMYGATCPCWTTGIWCPGWPWLAADTTAWYMTANSTPSEDWACRGTWTMWRGKSAQPAGHLQQLSAGDFTAPIRTRQPPLSVCAHTIFAKVGVCWAARSEPIHIHAAQRNMADGVARSAAVRHIAEVVGHVC